MVFLFSASVVCAGNFTVSKNPGDSANFDTLTAAILAANSDGPDSDVITILDSSTYSEDFPYLQGDFLPGVSNPPAAHPVYGNLPNLRDLTIQAGTGAAPILEKPASGNGQAFRYAPQNGVGTFTLKGNAANPMIVRRDGANPVINTGPSVFTFHNIHLENLIVEKPNTRTGSMTNFNNMGDHIATNVEFRGRANTTTDAGIAVWSHQNMTYINCVIHVDGINDMLLFQRLGGMSKTGELIFDNTIIERGANTPLQPFPPQAGAVESNGLRIAATGTVTLRNNSIMRNFGFRGISIEPSNFSPKVLNVQNSTIENMGRFGVEIFQNATVNITGSTIRNCVGDVSNPGAAIIREDWDPGLALAGGTLNISNGSTIDSGSPFGIELIRGMTITISDSTLKGYSDRGISIEGYSGKGPYSVTVNNCLFDRTATPGSGIGIVGLGGAGGAGGTVAVNDCVFLGTAPAAFIGANFTTTMNRCVNQDNPGGGAFCAIFGDATNCSVTMDQCDALNCLVAGINLANSNNNNGSVVDSNFVGYGNAGGTAGGTHFNSGSGTLSVNYCVFARADATGRMTAGNITFGANNVDVTTTTDLYVSTTYGSSDYMKQRNSSPGATLNSGNGPETHTGIRQPENQTAVEQWYLY